MKIRDCVRSEESYIATEKNDSRVIRGLQNFPQEGKRLLYHWQSRTCITKDSIISINYDLSRGLRFIQLFLLSAQHTFSS